MSESHFYGILSAFLIVCYLMAKNLALTFVTTPSLLVARGLSFIVATAAIIFIWLPWSQVQMTLSVYLILFSFLAGALSYLGQYLNGNLISEFKSNPPIKYTIDAILMLAVAFLTIYQFIWNGLEYVFDFDIVALPDALSLVGIFLIAIGFCFLWKHEQSVYRLTKEKSKERIDIFAKGIMWRAAVASAIFALSLFLFIIIVALSGVIGGCLAIFFYGVFFLITGLNQNKNKLIVFEKLAIHDAQVVAVTMLW